jgi:predicted O-methyltransferase YrrM
MTNPLGRLGRNLGQRLRLLRIALTRRYLYNDLTAMVKEHGFELREVRANTHPLRFAAPLLGGTAALPDFAGTLGPADKFALADTFAWNSEPTVSEFLGELVLRLGLRTVVELGCFVGWTSAHLALALQAGGPGGRLVCVDANARFLAAARSNLAQRGLADGVEFVHGYSLDDAVLASLPARADLVFIDTSHTYEPTRREIAAYTPRLSERGMIALHDSLQAHGVRRALLEQWDRFETLTFATEDGNGLTVLRPRPVNGGDRWHETASATARTDGKTS